MDRFESDEQIVNYIKNKVENIYRFPEHRLYREEQIQFFKNVFKIRNSVEWIIRINEILKYIKYSISTSLKFALEIENPMDENEIKDMYTYYLEDSVYRLMVLWDMYKQFVNELYEVGFNRDDNYSIFKLKNKLRSEHIWEEDEVSVLETYLDSDKHQFVRDYLRNTFTHNVDPTSMNIFHDFNEDGRLIPNLKNIIPKHPFENLVRVVDDLMVFINLIKDSNDRLEKLLLEEIMLVNAWVVLKCGDEEKLEMINVQGLVLNKDRIGIYSKKDKCTDCEFVIQYEGKKTCKPIKIKYARIHENEIFTLDASEEIPQFDDK